MDEPSLNGLSLIEETMDGPAPSQAACDRNVQGNDLWRDAFIVGLSQEINGTWYVSTLELQLTSFEVCATCRDVCTFQVSVDKGMPLSLWGDEDHCKSSVSSPQPRQVPVVRARDVQWHMPTDMLVSVMSESVLLAGASTMEVSAYRTQGWYTTSRAQVESDTSPLLQLEEEQALSPRMYFEAMIHLVDLADSKSASAVSWPERLGGLRLSHLESGGTSLRWGNLEKARDNSAQNTVCQDSWPASLREFNLAWNGPDTKRALAAPSRVGGLARERMFDQVFGGIVLPASLLVLRFGGYFNQPIIGIVWPPSLQELTFGAEFDQPIVGIAWPASLRILVFCLYFDQPVTSVVWPASLMILSFGNRFDQSVTDVIWPRLLQELTINIGETFDGIALPACLLKLTFNGSFNAAIDNVVWPTNLQALVLGDYFDQPVENVVWPTSLWVLTFGYRFNRPIAAVKWPNSLKVIQFGHRFNEAISDAEWPIGLLRLDFGNKFSQTIEGTSWPGSMQQLTLGTSGAQPICIRALPSSLRILIFGLHFNQLIGEEERFPGGLEELRLGVLFNHQIDSITWPASLVVLSLSEHFDKPVHEVSWPPSLRQLSFGSHFNQPIDAVVWPPSLERLKFGEKFNRDVTGVQWPSFLKELEFGMFFRQPLDGIVWPTSLKSPPVTSGCFTASFFGELACLEGAFDEASISDGF